MIGWSVVDCAEGRERREYGQGAAYGIYSIRKSTITAIVFSPDQLYLRSTVSTDTARIFGFDKVDPPRTGKSGARRERMRIASLGKQPSAG